MARLGMVISALEDRPLGDLLRLARTAEEAGYEMALVPEAWGRDALVVLGYLAGQLPRIQLGTGIINVYSRSAALIAMAAATLDELTGGRAVLGLGVSGAAVVQGWHNIPFEQPLRRLREVTEAVRAVIRHDRRGFQGEVVKVAPAFALRLRPPRPAVPIFHASLTPAAVRQIGEVADGWIPTLMGPEMIRADMPLLEEGLAKAGRERAAVTVSPFVSATVFDDLHAARQAAKPGIAFYIANMGRFYAEMLTRHGFGAAVQQVQAEWQARRRAEAAAAVPDELVDAVALAGPAERCRCRLQDYYAAGIDLPLLTLPSTMPVEVQEATLRALAE